MERIHEWRVRMNKNRNNDSLEIKLELIDLKQENRQQKLIRSAEKKLRKVFWDRLEGKIGDC